MGLRLYLTLKRALPGYLRWYNTHRAHGTTGVPPLNRISQAQGSYSLIQVGKRARWPHAMPLAALGNERVVTSRTGDARRQRNYTDPCGEREQRHLVEQVIAQADGEER